MSRVGKVVAVVKEIDIKGKIKLDFSGIVPRDDINKKEDIVRTNNRPENTVKEMSSFLSIIAILMQLA